MTSGNTGSPFVADPDNPTDEEIAAAIQRSLDAGTLIDAADWMARYEAETIATEPHVCVTWANAISQHGRETQCFADRDAAFEAAADGRRPWNNTRVDMYWHEAHDRSAEREQMFQAHFPTIHVWGLDCRECKAMGDHRAASAALVDAARLAAGDTTLSTVTTS